MVLVFQKSQKKKKCSLSSTVWIANTLWNLPSSGKVISLSLGQVLILSKIQQAQGCLSMHFPWIEVPMLVVLTSPFPSKRLEWHPDSPSWASLFWSLRGFVPHRFAFNLYVNCTRNNETILHTIFTVLWVLFCLSIWTVNPLMPEAPLPATGVPLMHIWWDILLRCLSWYHPFIFSLLVE